MIKKYHNQWVYYTYIILLPILPEYFRLGGSPVFIYLGFLPLIVSILNRRKKVLRFSKSYVKLIFPLLLLAIICFGVHQEFSSLVRYIMIPIILTYLITQFTKNEEQVYATFQILVYVGLVMCIFGLIERLFSFNVFSLIENADFGKSGTTPGFRNGIVRVELCFGNSISAALYMIFINCISFTLMKHSYTTKANRRVCLITYLLSFLIVMLTSSRVCSITCILMQVLFFMRERWNTKAVIIIGLVSVFALDLALNGPITLFLSRHAALVMDILMNGTGTSDTNTLYRFELFSIFIPMIKEKFWFGYGNEFLNSYRFAILGGYAVSIDNMFLETFARHGLFGFLITIIPIIKMFDFTSRLHKKSYNSVSYNFTCMTVIYLINLINVAQIGEQRLFYIIWGLLFVLGTSKWSNYSDTFKSTVKA